MKLSAFATLVFALVSATSLHAQNLYFLAKAQRNVQRSSGAVTADPTGAFRFSFGSPLEGTITTPGGTEYALTYDSREGEYNVARTFDTKAALDAAFPNGTYAVRTVGGGNFNITITGDLYPAAPQLTSGTWNAGGNLLLQPGVAATLNFSGFPTYGTAGISGQSYAEFGFYDSGVELDQEVFSRAIGGVDLPISAQPITSFSIPASSLQANRIYAGSVENTIIASASTTLVSGAIVATFYTNETHFDATAVSGQGGTAPAITQNSADRTVAFGGSFSLPLVLSVGQSPSRNYVIDWSLNGRSVNITDTSKYARPFGSDSLIVRNVTPADAGKYVARIVGTGGNVATVAANVTVTGAPSKPKVTRAPLSQSIKTGESVTLDVVASGSGVLSYQWNKNGQPITGATGPLLTLTNASASTEAKYTVSISNSFGATTSNAADIRVTAGPSVRTQPESEHTTVGAGIVLSAGTNATGVTYQWTRNGVAISGATSSTYTIPAASLADMGFYSCTITSGSTSTRSDAATVTVADGAPARPINISARANVTDAEPLIAGFVIPTAKRILVRAVGPTLTQFGLTGVLEDPQFELIPLGSSTILTSNNDWGAASNLAELQAAMTATGATPLPTGSKDAAVVLTVPAGPYTALVRSTSGGSGVAIVEVFDADGAAPAGQLINISARSNVGRGANVLIAGFVVTGEASRQVLVRAIGPGLNTTFGVTGVLADPQVTIIPAGADYAVASNDNWGGGSAISDAATTVGAFALAEDSKDAAILLRLPPGGYTALVSGVGDTTGNALVEVYDMGQ